MKLHYFLQTTFYCVCFTLHGCLGMLEKLSPTYASYNIKNETGLVLTLHFDHLVGILSLSDSHWTYLYADSIVAIYPMQTIRLCNKERWIGEWIDVDSIDYQLINQKIDIDYHTFELLDSNSAYSLTYCTHHQDKLGHIFSIYNDTSLIVTWVDICPLDSGRLAVANMKSMDMYSIYDKDSWIHIKDEVKTMATGYEYYENLFILSGEFFEKKSYSH